MEWTRETPTEEGYYWRCYAGGDVWLEHILRLKTGLRTSNGTPVDAVPVSTYWMGPLVEPEGVPFVATTTTEKAHKHNEVLG